MSRPTWGIVATIKAPTKDVLEFAAYHLDLGADDITIFLDDCNEATAEVLSKHPKIKCILTDQAHWEKTIGRRPVKHQVRQVRNASYYYRRAQHLDWVAHIDVDEFICAKESISDILADAAPDTRVLRMLPCESLGTDDRDDLDPSVTYCKAKLPGGPKGKQLEHLFYPQFGGVLKSGFVSHVVGKIFARTGMQEAKFGIHRIFENKEQQVEDVTSEAIELCHTHIQSWEKWLKIMEFRLSRGSYRAELEQSLNPASGRVQRHQLFTALTEGGNENLRAFYEEVCWATPRLREVLADHGYLREYQLDLTAKCEKHFPDFS
ncbi:glycosyltransferase family 2 protein [Cognatishimia activa]|uniref:glycosyltransferase family 2 protein n=1 Tax=Cognatishimia activa TaxID=1715691 RepID=UPI00222FBAA5|nr:glycosyltransferase family 2 protein [Cognatishimia activa]UZD91895.1 glycosyltransferase family 2 protein [Cognatishimia activa]